MRRCINRRTLARLALLLAITASPSLAQTGAVISPPAPVPIKAILDGWSNSGGRGAHLRAVHNYDSGARILAAYDATAVITRVDFPRGVTANDTAIRATERRSIIRPIHADSGELAIAIEVPRPDGDTWIVERVEGSITAYASSAGPRELLLPYPDTAFAAGDLFEARFTRIESPAPYTVNGVLRRHDATTRNAVIEGRIDKGFSRDPFEDFTFALLLRDGLRMPLAGPFAMTGPNKGKFELALRFRSDEVRDDIAGIVMSWIGEPSGLVEIPFVIAAPFGPGTFPKKKSTWKPKPAPGPRRVIAPRPLSAVRRALSFESRLDEWIRAAEKLDDLAPVDEWIGEEEADLRRLVWSRRYDVLDETARRYRVSGERMPEGRWKLAIFYRALASPNDPGRWNQWIDALSEWTRREPQSVAARTALGEAYAAWAWDARGGGWASEVADTGWRIFRERLELARAELEQAVAMEEKCPGAYAALIAVGTAAGMDRGEVDRLFRDGVNIASGYHSLYFNRAAYLMPRWNGRAGEVASFAAEAADATAAQEGDGMYARIAWIMAGFGEPDSFEVIGMDWERIQRGFIDLMEIHPETLRLPNTLCYLAWRAGDRETADKLRDFLGARIEQEMAGDAAEREAYWKWMTRSEN